jgi:hypothetical protein
MRIVLSAHHELGYLFPLAGRGRRALARRERGTLDRVALLEIPPHPDSLPASGERERRHRGLTNALPHRR